MKPSLFNPLRTARFKHADHIGEWRRGFDAMHMPVVRVDGMRTKRGAPTYLVRNEEWVVKPELVVPVSVAALNMETIPRPNHDPTCRSQTIL